MSYTNKLVQDTLCIVLSAGVRGEFVASGIFLGKESNYWTKVKGGLRPSSFPKCGFILIGEKMGFGYEIPFFIIFFSSVMKYFNIQSLDMVHANQPWLYFSCQDCATPLS